MLPRLFVCWQFEPQSGWDIFWTGGLKLGFIRSGSELLREREKMTKTTAIISSNELNQGTVHHRTCAMHLHRLPRAALHYLFHGGRRRPERVWPGMQSLTQGAFFADLAWPAAPPPAASPRTRWWSWSSFWCFPPAHAAPAAAAASRSRWGPAGIREWRGCWNSQGKPRWTGAVKKKQLC